MRRWALSSLNPLLIGVGRRPCRVVHPSANKTWFPGEADIEGGGSCIGMTIATNEVPKSVANCESLSPPQCDLE